MHISYSSYAWNLQRSQVTEENSKPPMEVRIRVDGLVIRSKREEKWFVGLRKDGLGQ